MFDISHIPTQYPNADVQVFVGGSTGGTAQRMMWQKPRGKSMCHILLIGSGGNGGTGVIGANSTAAGGGGGASGSQTSIKVPLSVIPNTLFLTVPYGAGTAAYVSISDSVTANNVLVYANGGGNGGNASGATAGTAGTAGTAATAANMPLGWQWVVQALAGQAGGAGTSTTAGSQMSLPVTGLLVCGGGGGAGLPAAATSGNNGSWVQGAGVFPGVDSGLGPTATTTPPGNGRHGYQPVQGLTYFYGGTGGASTHGSATGAGLVQSSGGNGAIGCGGGGSGGALTGSTAGAVGLGGPACCIITCW